jgi:alpha-D-xyloside xylohydrolase
MLDGRGDRRVLVRWVAAAAVCVLVSAATATSAAASEQPLSIDISDGSFPTIRVNGSFSYYLVSGNDRIALVGPAGTPDDAPQTLDLTAPDGRSACASITDGPEGTILLTLRIEDKGEFEKLGISLRVTETEGFYGLMERVVQGSQALSWSPGIEEGLNLRGQTVDLYMLPTVSIYAPFFLSSRGYGVFVDSDWPGTYRFGVDAEGRKAPTEVTIEQEGPELKLLLLPGPTPTDVVERYARLTGEPLLPPRFIFGPGRWRDEVWDLPTFYDGTPYDGPYNSMIVEDVLMMDALGIPCSFIVVDRPWAAGTFGYGDMRLDDARLPGFSNMVAWLDGRGIETLLWLGPWVMDGQRSVAISRGFHVPLTLPYLPNAALIDFTNGDALAWWIAELEPLFETGISGFKLDRGEEKPPDGQLFRGAYADGTNYRQGHNAYPLWFALAAEAAAIAAGVEDFALFYRAAWTGSSAHAVAWGGDTAPTSWGLRSALIGLQRAAVLNVPVWGSDTGGYNARPPREVLARWLAFSAFCPIMEVGPTANLAPWSWLDDASKDEISAAGYTFDTTYDVELLAIWSMYARIHDALGELLYALAEDAHERGTPIVRPMILAYPEDSRFVDTFEQYLLGPDLLVRPVWEEGADDVEVLLPEGTWIDAWSNRAYTGPTSILVETPLHVIPLFVRYGADVPLADLDLSWQNALARVRQRPDLGKSVTQVD